MDEGSAEYLKQKNTVEIQARGCRIFKTEQSPVNGGATDTFLLGNSFGAFFKLCNFYSMPGRPFYAETVSSN